MSAEILKVAEGGLVDWSPSKSVAPMDAKLLLTAETQLPQVMPGTLIATSVISPVAAVEDVSLPSAAGASGVVDVVAAGSPQPTKLTSMAIARQESKLRI